MFFLTGLASVFPQHRDGWAYVGAQQGLDVWQRTVDVGTSDQQLHFLRRRCHGTAGALRVSRHDLDAGWLSEFAQL